MESIVKVIAVKKANALVKFRQNQSNEQEQITTYNSKGEFETKCIAHIGDYIVTKVDVNGNIPEGEHENTWVMRQDTFERTYLKISQELAQPIPEERRFEIATKDGSLMAPWGEKQIIRKGDYIFRSDNGNEDYVVSMNEFSSTYDVLQVEYEGYKFRNLTPHRINLISGTGSELFHIDSYGVVRLHENKEVLKQIGEININHKRYLEAEGLPDMVYNSANVNNTYYIVSARVANAIDRDDLLIVDDTVRNEKGQIIGCKAFARV